MPRGIDALLLAADFLSAFDERPPVLTTSFSSSSCFSFPCDSYEINVSRSRAVSLPPIATLQDENDETEEEESSQDAPPSPKNLNSAQTKIIRSSFILEPHSSFEAIGTNNQTVEDPAPVQRPADTIVSARTTTRGCGNKKKGNCSISMPQGSKIEERENLPAGSTTLAAAEHERARKVYEQSDRILRPRKSRAALVQPKPKKITESPEKFLSSKEGAVANDSGAALYTMAGVNNGEVDTRIRLGREIASRSLNIPETIPTAQRGIAHPFAMTRDEVISIVNKFKDTEQWCNVRRPLL